MGGGTGRGERSFIVKRVMEGRGGGDEAGDNEAVSNLNSSPWLGRLTSSILMVMIDVHSHCLPPTASKTTLSTSTSTSNTTLQHELHLSPSRHHNADSISLPHFGGEEEGNRRQRKENEWEWFQRKKL